MREKMFSDYLLDYEHYCAIEEAKGLEPTPFYKWLTEQLNKSLEKKNDNQV